MTTALLLAELAKAWLGTLGLLAVQGALLALVALVLTRAGRLRPGWQAAIWLVVLARLALPWSPGLRWSLADLIARWSEHAAGGSSGALAAGPRAAHAAAHPWALAWLALGALWLVGALVVIAHAIRAQRRTRLAVRAARPAPAAATDLLARLAQRAGMRPPRLAIGAPAVGPYVVGAWRPTIVVPAGLLADPARLAGALLHELAHVRRRDGLGRWLQLWIAVVFYWWPFARLASRRLELAREAACDAWAIEAGTLSRPAYARLLVEMATLGAPPAGAPALAAPRALDARIAAVLGPPARAGLAAWHRVALGAWIVVSLGGARQAQARERRATCGYSPQLAEALFAAHPEADLDGDGTLSRDEACELQAELLRRDRGLVSTMSPQENARLEHLLSGPLCCNCERAEGSLPPPLALPEAARCDQVEGVDR